MLYHVGDLILCRVNNYITIIFDIDFYDSRYSKFKSRFFEVIGTYKENYYIIIAPETIIAATIIDDEFILDNKVSEKYAGYKAAFVREPSAGGREPIDPYKNAIRCSLCKEPKPYAENNQPDGTLICWVCRSTRQI